MYSIISFSIAACKSLRAPSCSSCSKNGFSASSARFSTEITLFSLTGVSFLFGTSGEAAEGLFFLLKGCAFSHLFIHNFRLYLGWGAKMRIFGIDPLMLGRGEWSDIDRIGFGLIAGAIWVP